MKNLLSVVVVLAVIYARGIESFPTGAPIGACDNLTPFQNPAGHADPPQITTVPYMINLTPFNNSGTWQYTPGTTYTLTLTGVSGQEFKGFFVQARIVADDSTRVGSFGIVDSDNSRLSSCQIDTDGITHSNNDTKTAISFRWTAPPKGTGALRFGFAVVRERNTYWADQRTPRTIAESAAVRLTSAGFWTILMVALAVVFKAAA